MPCGAFGERALSVLSVSRLLLTDNLTPNTGTRKLGLRGDADGEISGIIANGSTPDMPVYKNDGAGTWTLSGANTYSGYTEISAGALEISGTNGRIASSSGITLSGDATFRIRNAAAANHADRIKNTAALASSGGTFAFAHTGGSASYSETLGSLTLSADHTAITAYMEGGTVNRTPGSGNDQAFTIGRSPGSYGYFRMDGGTLNITRIQTGPNPGTTSNTIANVLITGGTLTFLDYIFVGRSPGSQSAFTLAGGTIYHTNATECLSLSYEGGRAELNITGGTLESYGRDLSVKQNASYTGGATGILNLCVGLLPIEKLTTVAPATATRDITIAAPIQAPADDGVTAIEVADGGSGHIGEPYVEITGDGLGAITLAPNTGGGLTKLGSGTLTLSAANTYTGPTAVNGGTLKLSNAQALSAQSAVILAPGATLDLGGFTFENPVSGQGTITNGMLRTVISPVGTNAVGAESLTLSAASLTGTYIADVALDGTSDLFTVNGNLDVSGLTLVFCKIQNSR